MQILTPDDSNLMIAAMALREGKLVAFPTETVYGLGAHAFDSKAVVHIFEVKQRPTFDPLIVHLYSASQLPKVIDPTRISSTQMNLIERLIQTLWPGPLTLVLPRNSMIPDLVTSGLPTVAVRVPSNPVAQRLLEFADCPIAAPSANPFGYLSPTRAEHVRDQLGEKVDYIIDGGRCSVGVESTILDISENPPLILRQGGTPQEVIEALIGPIIVMNKATSNPRSPGQLPGHYAPHIPLELYEYRSLPPATEQVNKEAYLFFDEASCLAWQKLYNQKLSVFRVLSSKGSLTDAAANLFDVLHTLDSMDLRVIRVERAPDKGLGVAINDRLYRARSLAKRTIIE
jgi:L-threonylcarbamoyladenylate synthase